jgi:hypothetical protein
MSTIIPQIERQTLQKWMKRAEHKLNSIIQLRNICRVNVTVLIKQINAFPSKIIRDHAHQTHCSSHGIKTQTSSTTDATRHFENEHGTDASTISVVMKLRLQITARSKVGID